MSIIQNPAKSTSSPDDTTVAGLQVTVPAGSQGGDIFLYLDITLTAAHINPPIFHYLIVLPNGTQIDGSGPIQSGNPIDLGSAAGLMQASAQGKYALIQYSVTKVNKGDTVQIVYHFTDGTNELVFPPDSVTGLNPNAGTEWLDTGVKFA